jgi:hypothetical protein
MSLLNCYLPLKLFYFSTCRSTPVPTATVESSAATTLAASEAAKPGRDSPVTGTATPTTSAAVVSKGIYHSSFFLISLHVFLIV